LASHQVVSVAGPSKTGKTVLCRKSLGEREYVWIDGGEIDSVGTLWNSVCSELNIPSEVTSSNETTSGIEGGLTTPVISAKGSKLRKRTGDTRAIQEFGADLVKPVLYHDCWRGPCVALWKLTALKEHRNRIKKSLNAASATS